jgi:PQQ-dependent catabolism-associated CXXCW motif protein
MKRLFFYLALLLGFGVYLPALAMTVERVGNDLYASGPTVDQDFRTFKEAFAQGGVERLILVNAPGGDLWTGLQVASMVQDAKIKTVVSGYCMSACSLIFMAGKERAFGNGHLPRVTMLGIHGAHSQGTRQLSPAESAKMIGLYKQQMGEKFDAPLIEQALYGIKEAGGFLRIREIERNLEKDRTPWFCPDGKSRFEQCQRYPGKDAYKLGVVTQIETLNLTLPESVQTKLGFFGQALAVQSLESLALPALQALFQGSCAGNTQCVGRAEDAAQKYVQAPNNKAAALGWGKPDFSWRVGEDNAGQALLRALYQCNHAKDNPKLCRLVALNEHRLLPFYEDAQNQLQSALKTLKAIPPESALNERNEPGANTPSKLRTGDQITGMTPRVLEGIQRLDTADMVQLLMKSELPVLIDVASSGGMLPGALNFIHGGLAFGDDKLEAAYAERFRHMLLAAAPDLNQAVAFYCASDQCWLSVNAAMRARQIGYTRVMWYRGGLAAWTRSSLPTVGRTPVAILN